MAVSEMENGQHVIGFCVVPVFPLSRRRVARGYLFYARGISGILFIPTLCPSQCSLTTNFSSLLMTFPMEVLLPHSLPKSSVRP